MRVPQIHGYRCEFHSVHGLNTAICSCLEYIHPATVEAGERRVSSASL